MDMKKILQAMDATSTKPVEGSNDMAKFMTIVTEGANPHKVTLPVQMAMQHYAEPKTEKKVLAKESIIGKYFTLVEEEQAQKEEDKKQLVKQYASIIAERVRLKESKKQEGISGVVNTVKSSVSNAADKVGDALANALPKDMRPLDAQTAANNVGYKGKVKEAGGGPIDTVTMDIPLMIRLFEYAREDAKTDMDLHNVADRMIAMSQEGATLTMDDYSKICPQQHPEQGDM